MFQTSCFYHALYQMINKQPIILNTKILQKFGYTGQSTKTDTFESAVSRACFITGETGGGKSAVFRNFENQNKLYIYNDFIFLNAFYEYLFLSVVLYR